MNLSITPGHLHGNVNAVPSKAFAHREMILAAFSDKPTDLLCAQTSRDIEATARCLRALGADIRRYAWGYRITPAREIPSSVHLPCGESGSTLRFLLPVAGALGLDAVFFTEGRLRHRPLSPLWEEMKRMGCRLEWQENECLHCSGQLHAGLYQIDGGISSQFITGLLLGLNLLPEQSILQVTGTLQSAPYLDITLQVLRMFGIDTNTIGTQQIRSPGEIVVEGDWSNAAFFFAANSLGSTVTVNGLNGHSVQGDRAVTELLAQLQSGPATISAAHIPDLIPVLAVAAAHQKGAVFTEIQRLCLKESDRVSAIIAMLGALGIRAESNGSSLQVYSGLFTGGTVDAMQDHRIAMAAAVAATVAEGPVTILGAECVSKSYPGFWEDYKLLGGLYELNIR